MKQKVAMITGCTGQTGSYLAELLIEKGYKVIGIRRRTSNPNLENVASIINNENFILRVGDITDYACVRSLMMEYKPDELYNLAAQSFVKESFSQPFHTFDVDAVGVLNFLEVLRQEKLDCKMYQASTSEMFGKSFSCNYYPYMSDDMVRYDGGIKLSHEYAHKVGEAYQDELTPFQPQSPYGIAKLAAHHLCRLYRDSYGIYAACGILFNHESPRRGKEFLTRKVTDYVGQLACIHKGDDVYSESGCPSLLLGNLEASRDWGAAQDYARSQYLILQQDKPDDFVVCTEETHTVREFCDAAFKVIGLDYKEFVEVDSQFYRPAEVDYLKGDCSKAKKVLGWKPEYTFKQLVKEMVEADIDRYK